MVARTLEEKLQDFDRRILRAERRLAITGRSVTGLIQAGRGIHIGGGGVPATPR